MAAFSDPVASSSCQNTVQNQFVDEEDLPLASIFERRESEDEMDADFEESEEEEEENQSVLSLVMMVIQTLLKASGGGK